MKIVILFGLDTMNRHEKTMKTIAYKIFIIKNWATHEQDGMGVFRGS
jgi:hypothetical protein